MRTLMVAALASLALSTSGCLASAGWTPSNVLDDTYDQISARFTIVPSEAEAEERWALPAQSPWAAYAKLTPLSALGACEERMALPEVAELEVVQRAEGAAALLASYGLPPKTMWVVDMRGAASVAFGAMLSQRSSGAVAPVPVFENRPSDREVIPAKEALAALVSMSPKLPEKGDKAWPVFLLDAWRRAYLDSDFEGYVDNRYSLSPGALPSARVLGEQGITRVLYLVEEANDVSAEEDDVREVLAGYREAGIGVAMVDLDDLNGLKAPPMWDPRMGVTLNVWGPGYSPYGNPLYRPFVTVYDPFYFTRPRAQMFGGWSAPSYGGIGGRGHWGPTGGSFGGGRSYHGATPRPGH